MTEARQSHWQRIYREKEPTDVSWYQPVPERSLQLIRATGVKKDQPILDAGGGASTLVDHLLAEGYTELTVLDISGMALQRCRVRLGKAADSVLWIETDVTTFKSSVRYALWHDRAVFHFLTDPKERDKYIDVMHRSLQSEGQLVLATFGPEGPQRCSGLEIQRYDIDTLTQLIGKRFSLLEFDLDMHQTPSGASQQFLYSRWQMRD